MDPLHRLRNYATVGERGLESAHDVRFPGTFQTPVPGEDTVDLQAFQRNVHVKITRLEGNECEFDLVGVHASLANSFRRILIAEVPTIAIEKVFIKNNTSIIQDEVLAHRLGLIPIAADPRQFEFPKKVVEGEKPAADPFAAKPKEHLVFKMKLRCKKNTSAGAKATDPDEMYLDHKVYSGHLAWKPVGNQADWFPNTSAPRPVEDNILIAKLRPGHEIDLKVHCVKGVGKDHAKFSPVATGTYRFLTEIDIVKPVYGQLAEQLQKAFSPGVIELDEDVDESGQPTVKARVANARIDSGSREVFRKEQLKDLVDIRKRKDYFLFSIESTGALPPDVLMQESIKIMIAKCKLFSNIIRKKQKEAGGAGVPTTPSAAGGTSILLSPTAKLEKR